MKGTDPPTPEEFVRLLEWIDRDRDRARGKYYEIRCRLIKVLARRGYHDAEEVADETINRVSHRVLERLLVTTLAIPHFTSTQ